MPRTWQDVVTDTKERSVFEALADPRWDFRTLSGIARSVQMDENDVKAVLTKYPDLVRVSPVPDSKGDALYTLRSRKSPRSEGVAIAQRAFSKRLK